MDQLMARAWSQGTEGNTSVFNFHKENYNEGSSKGASTLNPCLCVYDIDRTLTGKQGGSGCPHDKVIKDVKDPAYGGGPLTLSVLAQNVPKTFCKQCHAAVVSAGTGGKSDERDVLFKHLNVNMNFPQHTNWSPSGAVNGPLVTSWQDGKKQDAVKKIVDWYSNRNIKINPENVHFFDDRADNIAPFKNTKYNARQVSCKSRDEDGQIGLCGATTDEVNDKSGIYLCPTTSPP